VSSTVRRVGVQRLDAPSRETRGAREKGSRWIRVAGEPSDLYVGSCIGVSWVEARDLGNRSCEVARHDILTRSGPPIIWDTCQQIPKSQSSRHRSFRR
jgi:hypothetical protein